MQNAAAYRGIPATLTFDVLEGNLSSSSPASGAAVKAVNLTTGASYSASTGSSGSAALSLTAGWYLLTISSPSSAYVSFQQEIHIAASSTITRYLLPASGTSAVSSHGGSGTIWFYESSNAGKGVYEPQLNVTLLDLNLLSPHQAVASAYTGSNGSVEFTSVDTSHLYAFKIDGYSNPLSGVRLYQNNVTTASHIFMNPQTLVVVDNSLTGLSGTTGTVTGGPGPSGNLWSVKNSTVITGGTTFLSLPVLLSAGVSLTFNNAIVYFNESWGSSGAAANVTFSNSVVYFLAGGGYELQAPGYAPNIVSTNSVIFANMVRSGDSIVLGFTNASNSLFYYVRTSAYGAVYGSFYNDIILNSTGFGISPGNATGTGVHGGHFDPHTNMTRVSIINSRLTGGNTHVGNVNFTRVSMTNSSTAFAAYRMNGYYFMMNETVPPNGGVLNAHFWNMTQSELTFTIPDNMSYTQYVNSLPSNNYGNPPGAGPYVAFTMDGGGSGMGMAVANFSYSYLTWGFPMVNISPTFGGFDQFTNFYNCYFNYNDSQSQLAQVIASYNNDVHGLQPNPNTTRPFYGNRINLVFHGPVGMNYSYVNFGDRAFMNPWSHTSINSQSIGRTSYWTHDIFPYKAVMQDTYSYFRFFPSNPPGSVEISNDTFGYIYWNWTNDMVGNNQEGFADIWMETATNTVFSPLAYINITYDTFDAPSFSAGPNGMAGNIQFVKSYVVGNVSHCKFLNSPDYVLFPHGVSNNYRNWYLPPHQDNILASSSTVTIYDNYFLNLTNLTMPIGTDQTYQNGGNGGSVTEFGNHFFYYPLPGMADINASWAYSSGGYYGQQVPSYVGIGQGYNGSNIAYEIPMGLGATLTVRNGGAYVFNTTVGQSAPSSYVTNPQGYQGSPSQYSWAIEPNFVWNGSAYVAEYNGMGGPQPNLTYNGHTYQWSFEPNMTYISSDSSTASAIPMRWSIPNPTHSTGTTSLYLHNYSSNTNQLLTTVSMGYYSTNITRLYRPWADGTTAIFFLNSTITYTPPPPPPPKSYSVTFTESGLPAGTAWGVRLASTSISSTNTSIGFEEQNGTYAYAVSTVQGWTPSVTYGNLTVNGSGVSITVAFARVTYAVTFHETGLSGQAWNVTLGATTQESSLQAMLFNEPNGSYTFTVAPPAGYTANITNGTVNISGSPVSVYLTFNATQQSPPPTNTSNPPPSTPPAGGGSPVLLSIGGIGLDLNDIIVISVAAVLTAAVAAIVWRFERSRRR